jgi:integrase
MATLKFFLRSKTKKSNLVPIYARLRAGRKTDQFAKTGYLIIPEYWNEKTATVKNLVHETIDPVKMNKNLRDLNSYILDSLSDAVDVDEDWLAKTINTFHNPVKASTEGTDDKKSLFAFIQDFIDKAPTRPNPKSGRPVCDRMIAEYKRTFHFMKEFAKQKIRKIDFENINLDFYHDFSAFLTSRNLATNTIGKKIQTLKIFLNAATDAGYNTHKHYKSHRFTTIKEDTESIHLTEEELQILYDHDFSEDHKLEQFRDLFLIGAWTGLRFSDWSQVKPENIEDGLLSIKQSKTGGKVWIPLHPMVESILDKYNGQLPYVTSNQNVNRYLKYVGKEAKLDTSFKKSITKGGVKQTTVYKKWELLSTHAARRSFATNAYNAGVPSLTIMAITGHKTETSFLKYLKVTPKEHALKLRNFWQNNAKSARYTTKNN